MLRVEGLIKDYGSQRVLDGATLVLKPGERAALVGPNGAGKSTLLKIVAGCEEADGGRVSLPTGDVLGYLPQDAAVDPTRTLHDEVLSALEDLQTLEAELLALEQKLEEPGLSEEDLDELVHQHARHQELYEMRGGYAIEAEVGRVLDGLGFALADKERLCGEFSGGWQMRIALARLLLTRPDVLLLDEPTNHLDLEATEWLEDYLRAARGSLLMVSHDRTFMDALVQRVFELRNGTVDTFVGNYAVYRAERQRRDEALETLAERQQEEIDRVAAYVRRYKAGNRATMAKSREKMLERLKDARVEAPDRQRSVAFSFPSCPPSGREVVLVRNLWKAYAAEAPFVLRDVSLTIERGDRVAFIGPNGAGKSTLLKLIAGVERPTRGSAAHGVGVRPAYFAQDQSEQLDRSKTVLQEVFDAAPASWEVQVVRDLLGRFRFSGDEQVKPVAGLSGGERSRVALAKMLLRPSNLLLLDEPTNHLDVATRERLEETLSGYPGTLVFVTHDRTLVDRLATKVVEVSDGGIRVYVGNYADYRRARQAEQAMAQAAAAEAEALTRAAQRQSRSAPPTPGRDPREVRRLAAELRDVERQVADAEARLKRIEAQLGDPSSFDGDLRALSAAHAAARAEVETLTARWEALALAAEAPA